MAECIHEWVKINEHDLNVEPPKVHIKCRLCASETYELESVWERQQALPKLGERVRVVEYEIAGLIKKLEELLGKKESKPETKKKGK